VRRVAGDEGAAVSCRRTLGVVAVTVDVLWIESNRLLEFAGEVDVARRVGDHAVAGVEARAAEGSDKAEGAVRRVAGQEYVVAAGGGALGTVSVAVRVGRVEGNGAAEDAGDVNVAGAVGGDAEAFSGRGSFQAEGEAVIPVCGVAGDEGGGVGAGEVGARAGVEVERADETPGDVCVAGVVQGDGVTDAARRGGAGRGDGEAESAVGVVAGHEKLARPPCGTKRIGIVVDVVEGLAAGDDEAAGRGDGDAAGRFGDREGIAELEGEAKGACGVVGDDVDVLLHAGEGIGARAGSEVEAALEIADEVGVAGPVEADVLAGVEVAAAVCVGVWYVRRG